MAQVAEKLNILKMTKEDRAHYSYYQKKLYNDRDELQSAEARGEARGKAAIARRMLIKGKNIEEIIDLTSLNLDQIEKLKSS